MSRKTQQPKAHTAKRAPKRATQKPARQSAQQPVPKTAGKIRLSLRAITFAALFVALVGAALQAPGWLAQLEATQFTDLTVRGRLQYVEPAQVHALAKPYLQAGFMAVDMVALQKTIEALPWIAHAQVRREWPGHMIITLREEEPAAIWNESHLINAYGEIFLRDIGNYESDALPKLSGPNGTQIILLTAYAEMKKLLNDRNADLKRVSLSDRRAWHLMVSKLKSKSTEIKAGAKEFSATSVVESVENEATVIKVYLGSELVEQRLARFVRAAWPVLQSEAQQIDYVDMRYTNGFAVSRDLKTGV